MPVTRRTVSVQEATPDVPQATAPTTLSRCQRTSATRQSLEVPRNSADMPANSFSVGASSSQHQTPTQITRRLPSSNPLQVALFEVPNDIASSCSKLHCLCDRLRLLVLLVPLEALGALQLVRISFVFYFRLWIRGNIGLAFPPC